MGKIFIIVHRLYKLYRYWVLLVFKLKRKINFSLKLYFPYFFAPSVRDVRESCWNPMPKRENLCWHGFRLPKQLKLVLSCFLWWGELILGGFFTLKLTRKTDLILIRFFCFGLISGFGMVFYFFEAMIGLLSYLWCFLGVFGKKKLKFIF